MTQAVPAGYLTQHTLDVLAEDVVSGWLWCQSGSGAQSWVPINTVDDVG